MRKIILLVFAIFLYSNCQSYQKLETQKTKVSNNSKENLIQWINNKVDSVVQKNNIPALSIGVIKDGTIIMKKGIGILNRSTKQPTTENTIYQIASDTKKMTGVVVKNLVNENKLELDKPIIHYLGSLLKDEAKGKLKNITLRHLLLHKSGLPYRQPTMTRKDGEPMLIPYSEKLLLKDLDIVELKPESGTKFGYSNFGYAIVGYICEIVSKKNFAELIQQYISKAYDMPNTTIILTNKQKELLATPYLKENRNKETSAFNMGKLSSAGGVYSTINDLTKLMMFQINVYNEKVVSSHPLILTENFDNDKYFYGFGLARKSFDKGTKYGHGGDMDGFASDYAFSPEFKSGVIILTSSGGKWVGELQKELFAKLTNQKYILPKKSIAQEIYNIISIKDFKEGKKWFKQHKKSKKFYLKEQEMNNVGYALLKLDKVDDALEIFKFNTKLFPNSANVYNSLAECYFKIGNKELALSNYKKSLELNPKNSNAKKQIDKVLMDKN
ncbi:serine hydrolase [uncultured Polaribacter sp.]|uniref:serine hydrolase n=1 Tax=uncultured Polaribacter sp. TaxID=174711 RepID=UPI0026313467|nr:serine hydrolase [uncultured Polaribacter sp.]